MPAHWTQHSSRFIMAEAEEDLTWSEISAARYRLRLVTDHAQDEEAHLDEATRLAYVQQLCVRGRANRRLFTAVDTGYLVGLRAALRRGADINVTDFGWTPLNWAVHLMTLEQGGPPGDREVVGCPDVIIELLAAGADPNEGHEGGAGLRRLRASHQPRRGRCRSTPMDVVSWCTAAELPSWPVSLLAPPVRWLVGCLRSLVRGLCHVRRWAESAMCGSCCPRRSSRWSRRR